jgi:hypothetical protein
MRIFYGAGHEQFAPSDLLRHAQLAADAGFDGICCSDHFQQVSRPQPSRQPSRWTSPAAPCRHAPRPTIGWYLKKPEQQAASSA